MKKIDLTNFEGTADQLGEQVFKQLIAPMLDEMKSQDTKEQRQAFDEWHYEQYLLENPNIDISNAKYIYDYAHKNVLVFQLRESHFTAWQAAKAQAAPEGFVLVPVDQLNQWGHMANYAEQYGCPECFEARGYAHTLTCEINEYFAIEAQEPAND